MINVEYRCKSGTTTVITAAAPATSCTTNCFLPTSYQYLKLTYFLLPATATSYLLATAYNLYTTHNLLPTT